MPSDDRRTRIEVTVLVHSSAVPDDVAAGHQVDPGATHALFVRQAAEIAEHVIRPAMDSALAFLAQGGGGGRIEECPGDDTHSMRLILWMPLDLDLDLDLELDLDLDLDLDLELDRPLGVCRNPYLEFAFDVATCRVRVRECDLREKEGAPSAATPCPISDITASCVTERVIDILRRAIGSGTGEL
jgi:hypothetical protein